MSSYLLFLEGQMSSDSGKGLGKGIIKVKFGGDLCVFTTFFSAALRILTFCVTYNVRSSTLIMIAEVCTKHCLSITPNVFTVLKTSLKVYEYAVGSSSGKLILRSLVHSSFQHVTHSLSSSIACQNVTTNDSFQR